MRRTCKMAVVIALIAMLMGLTSCGGLFTTSLASGAARDPADAAAAMASMPTADLVTAAANVYTPAQAQSVVSALSIQAASDPDAFLESIDSDMANTILNTSLTACIDMTSLASNLASIIPSGNESSSSESDSSDSSSSEMMSQMLPTILGSCNSVDTTCVEIILDNSLTVSNGVPTLNDNVAEDEEMMNSLEIGAISVAASALSGVEFNADALGDTFENLDNSSSAADIVSSIIPNADSGTQESLATAINMLIALNSAGHTPGSFLMSSFGGN